MRGDFTSHNDKIYSFLTYSNSVGVTSYIIYGPAKSEGLVLQVIIRYSDIVKAIDSVEN